MQVCISEIGSALAELGGGERLPPLRLLYGLHRPHVDSLPVIAVALFVLSALRPLSLQLLLQLLQLEPFSIRGRIGLGALWRGLS